jgi:hypothetical protein
LDRNDDHAKDEKMAVRCPFTVHSHPSIFTDSDASANEEVQTFFTTFFEGVRLKREKLSRPASLPIVFKFAIELAAT